MPFLSAINSANGQAQKHQVIPPPTKHYPSIAHFSEFPAEERDHEPTMVSAKILSQLAKKWRRMASLGGKRLTATAKEDEECCTASAVKGHCIMYTTDGRRFKVPLVYLSTMVPSDSRITLPCDAGVMDYVMCLLRRNASAEVENALLSTMVTCGMPSVGSSQQICCL